MAQQRERAPLQSCTAAAVWHPCAAMGRRGGKDKGLRGWLRRWKRRLLFWSGLALAAAAAFLWYALHDLPDVKSVREGRFTIERERASGQGTLTLIVGPKSPDWTPLSQISKPLREAVITAEDDLFYEHEGFNLEAIKDSMEKNLKEGRYARGGSTITQQLAKNLFLTRRKTLTRKIQEAYLAFWLEVKFTKDELLAYYLNIVEWGPDLYGIRRAARHYFAKHPSELTFKEAAFLAALLPSPKKRAAWAGQEPLPEPAQKIVGSILQRMLWRRALTEEQYRAALDEPLVWNGERF